MPLDADTDPKKSFAEPMSAYKEWSNEIRFCSLRLPVGRPSRPRLIRSGLGRPWFRRQRLIRPWQKVRRAEPRRRKRRKIWIPFPRKAWSELPPPPRWMQARSGIAFYLWQRNPWPERDRRRRGPFAARRTIGVDTKAGNVVDVGDSLARRTIRVHAKAWNVIGFAEARCWHENPWVTGHR